MQGRSVLSRFVRVEPGEGAGLLWSALSFFFILGGYYVIRPLRDEMGASTGSGFALNWLFFGTLAGTLVVNPLFGALVARTPR
ncbi:MAG: MFS transporter, partial [Thermoanaerobaculia bacterium]